MIGQSELFRVDLSLIVQGAHDISERCLSEVQKILRTVDGIDLVHAAKAGERLPVDGELPIAAGHSGDIQICIHFQAGVIAVPAMLKSLQAAGAEMEKKYGHVSVPFDPTHKAASGTIVNRLSSRPGITAISLSADGCAIRVEFLKDEIARAEIESAIGQVLQSTAVA